MPGRASTAELHWQGSPPFPPPIPKYLTYGLLQVVYSQGVTLHFGQVMAPWLLHGAQTQQRWLEDRGGYLTLD